MSVANFIPTIWTRSLLENLNTALVYGQPGVINRDYEGEIRGAGSSVKINSIGRISVFDYARNTDMAAPEELTSAQVTLNIDQERAFSFQLDDVDNAQTQPKLRDAAMREASYALAVDLDKHLAGAASAGAGLTGTYGTDPYEALVDAYTLLDENDVPQQGRFAIVPPFYHGLLRKDDRFVSFGTDGNRGTLLNAQIGTAAGFSVLTSNNVPETAGTYDILFGHSIAWTMAMQVDKVEAYRLERRFADGVKGLNVYGSKIVRPEALGVMQVAKP